MTRDRAELQAWYRQSMLGRIGELQALRGPLQAEDPSAFDAARSIGQALRGSGATFGFAHLTAVATVLETSDDRDALRRVEGLISELYLITEGPDSDSAIHAEWLLRAADLPLDDGITDGAADVSDAWTRVGQSSGLGGARLADAVARYLDLDRADLDAPARAALRLVPEALMAARRVIPLEESSTSIVVATQEPTSLAMELELTRVTGRTPVFAVAPPEELDAALALLLDRSPQAQAPAPAPRVVDEAGLSGRGILVVDDEPSARHLLRSLLMKGGFEVFEAGDGVEALERLGEQASIGLIVADLNMPRMDGLELIWEIRGDDARPNLPVIVVTGDTDEILETQLIEEGADDYIRKPVDPRLFLARVEATMHRHED